MAVVLEYNELGKPIISSYGKTASNQDQENAIELDKQLKIAIPNIEKDLIKDGLLPKTGNAKGNVANKTWWTLGKRISELIDDNPLIKASDWKLIWQAIELHSSDRIVKSFRGESRRHVQICYRLSKFPKDKVIKVKWSEWADYFGKPVLSKDPRSDIWMRKNIDAVTQLNRVKFRGMTKYFYNEVCKRGKIELRAKTDEKFYKLWDDGFQNYLETIKENEKGD